MTLVDHLRQVGIIPVVSLPKLAHALPLAESLLEGGLPCAEITFRTASAAEAIEQISQRFPELLLGAGTVLTTEQAQRAMDCGAQFIVSPGTNPVTVDYCLAKEVTIFPGVCTPTEIEMSLAKGIDVLKFFPAEPAGGVNFLKAICAPYKQEPKDYQRTKHIRPNHDRSSAEPISDYTGQWSAQKARNEPRD